MNTHDILLTIQYITVTVLFLEMWIVFTRWKNQVHSYLLFACVSSFISNIGYLMELKAGSEEAYLTALKLSYVGRVWIVFAFFMFSAKMCRIKIPKGLTVFLVALHLGIYASVLSVGSNNLYYSEYHFFPDPVFPRFYHTNGSMHDLLIGINAVLAVFGMGWVIRELRRQRNRISKLRMFMLIMAYGIQIFSFLLHLSGIVGISRYYDLTMPGTLFGTVFMLIGIFRFNLLGTREIARDFVIDRISEGIIAVDNDGRIQYYNEPAAKLYPEFDTFFLKKDGEEDSSKDEKNGNKKHKNKLHSIYTPYDIIDVISDAIDRGETLKIDGRIYTPEENELLYKGECYGKLYALVDDTEHYQYMKELKKQRDIADSANEAKSRFLANMSHEIRTPINAVLGMDEMILRESGEREIIGYAKDIMSAGRTLLSLINDILDLSKVEEGKMEIIPVQYDLSSLINDLVNMIRERAANKGLEFNVGVEPSIPNLLFGDEIRVRQCVMNILTNAVKYTEKGEVNFSISFEKEDEGHILLKFTVADTGIGMKEEDMENLFSPYKRIDEKRNRAIEGTGLGMSITRQLLDLMGSSLNVKSEYGKGSVFSFAVRQEVVKWEEIGDFSDRYDNNHIYTHEYHELFHAPNAHILVVDDTEMNLTVIKSLLKKTRIGIDTALSGREALEKAAVSKYDALFIDHMMPDMDGIETLTNIRISGASKDAPAVALTANAVSGAREMYLNAGFDDYLSKPVDGEKLERMLLHLIPEEKIDTCESTGEEPLEEENAALPEWLFEVKGLDVKEGLANCGSEEGYLSVLSVFHKTAGYKSDEIEKYLKDSDIENYTVKVHALKSSARIIGAKEISELAKTLEDAGKNRDTDYLDSHTGQLLKMYRELDLSLAQLDETGKKLPAISPQALREAYQTVMEIAGSMDYEMMENILNELHGYDLADDDKKTISEIERLLTELDWDGISGKAKEALVK